MKKEYVFSIDVHITLDDGDEFTLPKELTIGMKKAFVSTTNDLLDNSYVFDALQEHTELDVCAVAVSR